MNKILIAAVLLILCGTMLFGCTKAPDKNIQSINFTDENSLAVCADKTKKMVITQTPEGEVWECV